MLGLFRQRRCHHVGWRGLVAAVQAGHAIEHRAFYRNLDVVDQQAARRLQVTAAVAGASDKVTRRGGLGFKRQSTRFTHPCLTIAATSSRWLKQIDSSDDELIIAILGLFHVGIKNADGTTLRFAHSPAWVPDSKLERHFVIAFFNNGWVKCMACASGVTCHTNPDP
jgi:hypothetical protein